MLTQVKRRRLIKRIMLHAARWPIVLLLSGIALNALSYTSLYFHPMPPLTAWIGQFGNLLLATAIILFFYTSLSYLCLWYEKKLRATHKISTQILSSLRRSLRILLILAIGYSIFFMTDIDLQTAHFTNLLLFTLLILSLGWIGIQLIYTIEAVVYEYMTSRMRTEDQRAKTLLTKLRIIRNISIFLVSLVAIAILLMSFNSVRSIGISLLASAGFITAILGLSAQKTLFSLFAGIQIIFSQSVKIGDLVTIEKESGTVEEITFTYIRLKLADNRRLIVPISYFIERPFENWSRGRGSIRASIYVAVDFMMPIEPLRAEFQRILKESRFWDGKANRLQIADLGQQTVNIRLQVSAANADKLAELRAEVREKILHFIREQYPDYFPITRSSIQGS